MGTKAQILIIEDDLDTSEAMKLTLESQDHTVITADNPRDGIEIAKVEKPDLIILDVMFGRTEQAVGFDYAIELKKDKTLAPIPILMITAVNVRYPNFGFSPKDDGDYLPVDEFINKPAAPDDLISKVKTLLKQKTSKWVNWIDQIE
jgi:two-component system alkaline phosphatase synthesis response regulator PhoP